MTVSSALSTRTFNCDGSTLVFTCPFRVLEASEVVGYLITVATNESTPLVNGADFVVTGVDAANAIVTTTLTYSSAYQINLRRRTQRQQLTDYRDNDPFPAESHENALDRLTHIAQENDADVGRALLVPEPESGVTLPSATDRANLLLGFNSAGAPIAVAPASGSAADLALSLAGTTSLIGGDAMIGVKRAAAGAEGTTQHEFNERTLSVFDFMTAAQIADVQAGTLSLDTAPAFAAAAAAAVLLTRASVTDPYSAIRLRGWAVHIPGGYYLINSTISWPAGVALVGQGQFASVLKSSVNGNILEEAPTSGVYSGTGSHMSGFGIVGDRTKASQVGLALLRPMDATYEDLYIINCGGDGLLIREGLAVSFRNVISYQNVGCGVRIRDGIASWADSTPTNYPTNQAQFTDCHFAFNDGPGVKLDGTGTAALGFVNGCVFRGGAIEYNYRSSAAGTGYNVEDYSSSYFANQFNDVWFEDTKVIAHILKTATDPSQQLRLMNCRHTPNGAAAWPERFVIVTYGTVIDIGSHGTGNLYRTAGGSNAPYRLTKATARVELFNVSGCTLTSSGNWVEDETNAVTGLSNNSRVSNYGAARGPMTHWGESTDVGFEQYRVGDASAFGRFSAAERSIEMGSGSTAPVRALVNNFIGISSDRGDASVTVVAGVDRETQRFATALTANRTVTLSSTGVTAGHKFRIVRTGLGAFTLDVGGLKTIPSATAGWVDVEHDGTAWRLTGYGLL